MNSAKGRPLLGQSSLSFNSSEEDDNFASVLGGSPTKSGSRQQVERERRVRREIANSNERRRMQSINQGYNCLKSMLPLVDGGEKLSKAAVLQNAAEYMTQILDERKQLLIRNSELTQALSEKRLHEDGAASAAVNCKKRKKCDTESSDEGISLSYHPQSVESELLEELRRNVTELRVQLERERQRCTFLEQSYTYSLMAAQVAQQPVTVTAPSVSPLHVTALTQQQAPADTTVNNTTLHTTISPNKLPPSPPQSRHTSTDERFVSSSPTQRSLIDRTEVCKRADTVTAVSTQQQQQQSSQPSQSQPQPSSQQCFGKASSVASQNLSIIVEAINHLEGDQRAPTAQHIPHHKAESVADSGVSHGESSDDTKSECSRANTPHPPPAHQSIMSLPRHSAAQAPISTHNQALPSPVYPHHISASHAAAGAHTSPSQNSPVPLVYRPTFLSGYVHSQHGMSPPCPQSEYVPQANTDTVIKGTRL